jgi:hypothetical protein
MPGVSFLVFVPKLSYRVDNLKEGKANHFIVFVCFLNKIHDLTIVPGVYVVPSVHVPEFTYTSPRGAKRRFVELRRLRKEAKQFQNGWHLILQSAESGPPGGTLE